MNLFIKTTSLHVCARCMTLSVLETSLPVQRSHDTVCFWLFSKKLVSWIVTLQVVTHPWKNDQGLLRPKYDASTLGCEPMGAISPQATLSSQATSHFSHSVMRDNFTPWSLCPQELHPISVESPCSWSPWHHEWISSSRQQVYSCVQGAWHCLFWILVCQCREVMTPLELFWHFSQKLVSWMVTAQAVTPTLLLRSSKVVEWTVKD